LCIKVNILEYINGIPRSPLRVETAFAGIRLGIVACRRVITDFALFLTSHNHSNRATKLFLYADHPKNSTIDYKSNSSCSSPSKDMKNSDRCGIPYGAQVPVLPVRNNLRRPNSSHFPQASRFHFRKGIASKCTWKCTAIVCVILLIVLTAAFAYISGKNWFRLEKQI
jgi:hypothetical protein